MAESMEPEEAREPIAAGELFVLDVRRKEMWLEESERVPGAVHIPADELDSHLDDVPEDKRILLVTPDGEGYDEVAEKLSGEGREVVVLTGGVAAWRDERLLTQPSPDADPPKGEGEEPVETPEDDEDSDTSDDTSEGTSEGTSDDEEPPDRAAGGPAS
jgi:rhodanese-related sulfurtransferase